MLAHLARCKRLGQRKTSPTSSCLERKSNADSQESSVNSQPGTRITSHESHLLGYSLPMHDLGYFREHLDEFVQMAANRGVVIDFDGFRALDQERRERITAVERLKAERNRAS